MTTESNRNELGKMLKQQRLMLELTQVELAAKSGVSAAHIARIEKGERLPSGHILRKIAGSLGLNESLLMTIAGYLSSQPLLSENERGPNVGQLDPYVAKVLSEEPVEVQRTVVAILSILKGLTNI